MKAKNPYDWDWWGFWVVDWLTCARDADFASSSWLSFDIWAKAYREANPDFSEISDLELIEEHYTKVMQPVFNSWVFSIWLFLQWPMSCIHELVWRIKLKFFREF